MRTKIKGIGNDMVIVEATKGDPGIGLTVPNGCGGVVVVEFSPEDAGEIVNAIQAGIELKVGTSPCAYCDGEVDEFGFVDFTGAAVCCACVVDVATNSKGSS